MLETTRKIMKIGYVESRYRLVGRGCCRRTVHVRILHKSMKVGEEPLQYAIACEFRKNQPNKMQKSESYQTGDNPAGQYVNHYCKHIQAKQ